MTKLAIVLVIGCAIGCDRSQRSAQAPAGMSCAEVLQCVSACNNESTCIDRCLARGTQAAKSTMTAFQQCLVQHGCQSSECATTNCVQELTTCAADVTSGPVAGQPASAPPSSGPLVPALAGSWLGRGDVFTHYEFDGAGSVKRWLRAGTTGASGHTTYTEMYEERGTASQDGDTLVLEWSNAGFTKGGTERYSVAFVDFLDYKHTPKLTNLGCEPTSPDSCSTLLTRMP